MKWWACTCRSNNDASTCASLEVCQNVNYTQDYTDRVTCAYSAQPLAGIAPLMLWWIYTCDTFPPALLYDEKTPSTWRICIIVDCISHPSPS